MNIRCCRHSIASIAVFALAVGGCDRPPQATAPTGPPAPPILIISGEDRICWSSDHLRESCLAQGAPESQIRHLFSVPQNGTLRLETYFQYDYNDRLFIELHCGETLVTSLIQQDHSMGTAFEVPARTDCAYVLTFAHRSRGPLFVVRYVVTLTP